MTLPTIADARVALDARETTVGELLADVMRRLDATEPVYHAYARVSDDLEQRAARLDDELSKGDVRGPLHGVPIAVKDVFVTRDAPTEVGSKTMKGFQADYDAAVVERLRDAGALLVGKLALYEFSFGVHMIDTGAAWDPAFYPGGSSAGSGVAVALGSALGTIGTDAGGSVRLPAAMNGVVGLKPTLGRISAHGVLRLTTTLDHVGVITRTVADCATLLGVVAGHDPRDPGSIDEPVPDYASSLACNLSEAKLGVVKGFGVEPDVEVSEAFAAALEVYARAGADIVEIDLPAAAQGMAANVAITLGESYWYQRGNLERHGQSYNPEVRRVFELGGMIPATHFEAARRFRTRFVRDVRDAFDDAGLTAMVTPTVPMPSKRLSDMVDFAGDVFAYLPYLMPWNITGQPALQLNCGFSSSGMPVGLQLVGRPFDERSILALGHAYQELTEWHRAVPDVGRFVESAEGSPT